MPEDDGRVSVRRRSCVESYGADCRLLAVARSSLFPVRMEASVRAGAALTLASDETQASRPALPRLLLSPLAGSTTEARSEWSFAAPPRSGGPAGTLELTVALMIGDRLIRARARLPNGDQTFLGRVGVGRDRSERAAGHAPG
jgi:hypothetical protein